MCHHGTFLHHLQLWPFHGKRYPQTEHTIYCHSLCFCTVLTLPLCNSQWQATSCYMCSVQYLLYHCAQSVAGHILLHVFCTVLTLPLCTVSGRPHLVTCVLYSTYFTIVHSQWQATSCYMYATQHNCLHTKRSS